MATGISPLQDETNLYTHHQWVHSGGDSAAMKQLQWRRLQLQRGDVAAAPSP